MQRYTPPMTLAGRYDLLSPPLGVGSFGAVYLADDHKMPRQVAVKVLHSSYASDAKVSARFLRELVAACRVSHENVIQVLDVGDFATPVSAQVDVITSAFNDRLWVRNALSYTDGYRYLLRDGKDPATGLQRYDIEKQDDTLRWDLSTAALALGVVYY